MEKNMDLFALSLSATGYFFGAITMAILIGCGFNIEEYYNVFKDIQTANIMLLLIFMGPICNVFYNI